MGIPVLNYIVEDRTNFRIHTDLCIESLDKTRDLIFGDGRFGVHQGPLNEYLAAPDWIHASSELLLLDNRSYRQSRGDHQPISLVFTQPQFETSFENGDVRNCIVIDNAFHARPLHGLRGGIIENENRATRGVLKEALKLGDRHSEGIGNFWYLAGRSTRTQLNDDHIRFNHKERVQTFRRDVG
jgi:hypothetical protein